MEQTRIRNFCIIAHIDHGKSTLADRFLDLTHTVEARERREQVLDSMDLERERGITIKAHPIRMAYQASDNQTYQLNLIDTPGHVDFAYEVSRSLAACEGALLLVDAVQGVQAQTLSNLHKAMEAGLVIIPVINKIDLPSAQAELVKEELLALLDCKEEEILLTSAKEGWGAEEVLEAVVDRVPPPEGDPQAPLRALVFDSSYDSYRGAIPYIRIKEGAVEAGMDIRFMASGSIYEVQEIGHFRLGMVPASRLAAGEVGYLIASIKRLRDARAGDTITSAELPASVPLPGYREVKPMVFSGLYPADAENFEDLRDALERLKLNDAALFYEPETSAALGFGFRCGFLGLLHMEIVQERLEREFDLSLITTVPNVRYRVHRQDRDPVEIDSPAQLPNAAEIERTEEPYVRSWIMVPDEYLGNVMELCHGRRGQHVEMKYLDPTRVELIYDLPLAEIVLDFYDRLKSGSRGYATFDYEMVGFREGNLVKLDILINGHPVDALSTIMHRDKAYEWGKSLVEKLRGLIPRQLFEVVIQAAIGSRVIARAEVRPLRKHVTAKCYGGDITRKRKLLERQKEGKRRMKQVGNVEIPQEAFLAVLRMD